MGSRELRFWLTHPTKEQSILTERLNAISSIIETSTFDEIHNLLKHIGDIKRIIARIALKNARPRDLLQLKEAILIFPKLKKYQHYLL